MPRVSRAAKRREFVLPPDQDPRDTAGHPVTTALLLAAGAGTRLRSELNGLPKCLVEVSGTPILGRLLRSLVEEGFERLVVVVGHEGDQVRAYLDLHANGLEVECVESLRYSETNNIYSLWLARDLVREPFVLMESDLVFDSRLLRMLRVSNRIAVAAFSQEMNGTTVSIDESGLVGSFSVGGFNRPPLSHKTVNMYSLSWPIWQEVGRRLDQRIAAGKVNDYYEVVFAEMAAEGLFPLRAVEFDNGRWSEIDTPADLLAAEQLFSEPPLSSPLRS